MENTEMKKFSFTFPHTLCEGKSIIFTEISYPEIVVFFF